MSLFNDQEPPCPPSWSWILEGLTGWRWTSWWIRSIIVMLGLNFHQDRTSGTLSRTPRPPSWSWILEGLTGWRWSSWWVRSIIVMLDFKFHQDRTSGTLSRTPLSTILKLDLWWLWMKTEGGVVVRILLETVWDDFSNDCDHIQSCHIWTKLT